MAKVQKPCKICGKMFTPCADCERDKNMFHWRTVACSPECARTYFAKVEEARKHTNKIEKEDISIENKEVADAIPDDVTVVENSTKQKRAKRYSNVKNEEESEQIE